MTLEAIYVCRHGFRLSWETQTWASPTGIPRDPPLSAHGVDQAKELAGFLKRELGIEREGQAREEGVVVLSSPLYRCVQTATPTAEALGVPIFIEPGLAEWYLPVRRGLHPALASPSFLKDYFPLVDDSAASPSSSSSTSLTPYSPWTPLLTPPRVGESMRALHARTLAFSQRLTTALSARGVRKVIVFSHAATKIGLCRALAGDLDDPSVLRVPGKEGGREPEPGEVEELGLWRDEERLVVGAATCACSKFVRDGEGSAEGAVRWRREWDGRTDFMKRGEERRWDFSFVEEIAEDGIDDSTGLEISATKSDAYKNLPTAAPKETRTSERVEGKL